jgi:uncharacterized protein (DUF433 family)
MAQTLPGFDRLIVDPETMAGLVTIRGVRFTVEHLLELLAAGWSVDEIRVDFPFIEPEDVRQALGYAATLAHRELYLPLQDQLTWCCADERALLTADKSTPRSLHMATRGH